MVAVLKPVRGKRTNVKTNQKTAARDSTQRERKSATMNRTLSTSASSLGSEMVEELILDSPRKALQEVPDQHKTDGILDALHVREDVSQESIGDQSQWTAKTLTSDTAGVKPRNPNRVRNIFSGSMKRIYLLDSNSNYKMSATLYQDSTVFQNSVLFFCKTQGNNPMIL